MIRNPILPGFNPDPSILRVGNDYYLATSTTVWQPGIRLHHSTDLEHWTLIGHVLHDTQHDLRGLDFNAGIWAPSLTFDPVDGLFYVAYSVMYSTTSDYFDLDNFVVTATDIRGPWSAPSYLGSLGFDPSFFHDNDGRHWILTLEWDPRDGYQHPGPIVIEEYDAVTRTVIGAPQRIYRGGTDRGCLEGPVLFERDGWFYLMTAEGGTGFGHGVVLARSRNIAGPYEPGPVNPILTSNPAPYYGRNDHDYLRPHLFNPDAAVQKAGHGCLVDTPGGDWYIAYHGSRPLEPGHLSVLGRETSLQPVEWTDDGWLQLTTGGTVPRQNVPGPGDLVPPSHDVTVGPYQDLRDDFDGPRLDLRFSTLRRPLTADWASLALRDGSLSLRGGQMLTSRYDCSAIATQLQDFSAVATTQVSVEPQHFSQSAGLIVFYDNINFAYLRVYRSESLASVCLGVVLVRAGVKEELLLSRVPVDPGAVVLQARLDHGSLQFCWRSPTESEFRTIGPRLDATFMSDEATRGFTGTMIGLTCVDAFRRDMFAHFEFFDLRHGIATP